MKDKEILEKLTDINFTLKAIGLAVSVIGICVLLYLINQ